MWCQKCESVDVHQNGPTVYRSRTVFIQLLSWWEIFFGMMNFVQNGILCSHISIYWRIVQIPEEWSSTGSKRCVYLSFWFIILLPRSAASVESKLSSYVLYAQFPFFYSDREYIIARRIWEAGRTYYCITKVWYIEFTFRLITYYCIVYSRIKAFRSLMCSLHLSYLNWIS